MFQLISDKLERQPGLLDVCLENVVRWIANGSTQQDKLSEWKRMILQATPHAFFRIVSSNQ